MHLNKKCRIERFLYAGLYWTNSFVFAYFSPIKKKPSKKRKAAISDDEDNDELEDKNNDSFEAVSLGDDDHKMSDVVSVFS